MKLPTFRSEAASWQAVEPADLLWAPFFCWSCSIVDLM